MERMFKLGSLLVLAGALASMSAAQELSDAPPAPMPAQFASAKKVFISNGGTEGTLVDYLTACTGSPDGFYNQFHAAMKSWGRYQLVGAPADADLIFEIHLDQGDPPTSYPEFRVTIFDPQTHVRLWTVSKEFALAVRAATKRKEYSQTMSVFLDEVKKATTQTTAAASVPGK
jgi:hypothetical protein